MFVMFLSLLSLDWAQPRCALCLCSVPLSCENLGWAAGVHDERARCLLACADALGGKSHNHATPIKKPQVALISADHFPPLPRLGYSAAEYHGHVHAMLEGLDTLAPVTPRVAERQM